MTSLVSQPHHMIGERQRFYKMINRWRTNQRKGCNGKDVWLRNQTWLALKVERCFAIFVANRRRQNNPFGSAVCTNFQTSTLQRHKDCKDHEEALRDTFNNQQHHVMREQSHAIITAMKTVYFENFSML